jgi:anti-anti-sigma factor
LGQVPGRLSVDGVLEVVLTTSGRTAVLRLSGELDLATAPGLHRRLVALADTVETVDVEAAELSFLDLAGFDVLLGLSTRLRADGGALVVRAPSPPVRRLLALLDDPLPVES